MKQTYLYHVKKIKKGYRFHSTDMNEKKKDKLWSLGKINSQNIEDCLPKDHE